MHPYISIIIVNYNWMKRLEKCLSSIFSQTYTSFACIVVDNCSSDGSVAYIKQHFPQTVLVPSSKNVWFSAGNNLGVAHATGELLLFLNNDTRVENDFLEKYLQEYYASWANILWAIEKPYTDYDNKLRWTSTLTIDPFGHRYVDKTGKKLFYTNGACMLCRKDFYEKTGGLDNNFFMYCEEVDRQRRCRLYGYTIKKSEKVYLYHAGAGSSSGPWITYQTFLRRNQNTLQMLLKNYHRKNLCWVIPIYLTINIGEIIAFLILWKWRISISYLQWRWYTIQSLRAHIITQRKIIQQQRIVSDREIMKQMYWWFAKIAHLHAFLHKK